MQVSRHYNSGQPPYASPLEPMKNAVIYFGNALPSPSDETRQSALVRGRGLVADFPGVTIVRELPSVCALVVEVTEAGLARIRQVLAETDTGRVTVSDPTKPLVRVAR
jgi:hypothetical protein